MHQVVPTAVLAESLARIGEYVAGRGMTGDGPYQAARDLLMLAGPRVGRQQLQYAVESMLAAGMCIAPRLDGGFLPIQGPPGAGKTHLGARMICVLAQAGERIGITANSHKVIRNILDEAVEAADELGIDKRCVQKVSNKEENLPRIQFVTDNAELLGAIGASHRRSCRDRVALGAPGRF